MTGADLLRFAVVLVPVLLVFVAWVYVLLSLRASRDGRRDPLYLEQAGGETMSSRGA